MHTHRVLFVQRVIAEYRLAFVCELANILHLRILRGRTKGASDVIEAKLPVSIDRKNHVKYFFGERLWLHTEIINIIRGYSPEVVIVSPTLRDITNLLLILMRKRFGYKIIGWGMGEMPGRGNIQLVIHRLLQKIITDRLDALVVYSSSAKDYYENKLGYKKRIEIAPNAVDLSDFTKVKKTFKNEKEFTIVCVGRIIKAKKIDKVIEFVKRAKGLRLKIVGSGDPDYIKFLKSEIGEHHDRIEFVGPLFGEELNKFLIQCDLFVLPSRGGLAINHAMASGLPVLVSVGDGTEKDLIIDRETGFIFEDNNFAMMAELIIELRNDPTLLQRVSVNAVQHVRSNFSIENMCQVFHRVVGEIK